MKELLMAKGARTLIDVCTKVKPGETVLVITDMYRLTIAKVIAGVAMDRGAEAIVTVIQPRERNGQHVARAVLPFRFPLFLLAYGIARAAKVVLPWELAVHRLLRVSHRVER